ncbi:hypothetical protein [Brevibacillus reuszeri]|uniref:hypothetical protein n=1 Tax=Brevibacillus reuszeri TaxID=54915 RepID=UPI000CCC537F|nr:hypothetical protein [Brevibacillus reuszeri]
MSVIGKRIGLTLDEDTKKKLSRLSISCSMQPTTLANELVKICLNNPNIVEFVQRLHNKEPQFRVKPRINGDQCIYE